MSRRRQPSLWGIVLSGLREAGERRYAGYLSAQLIDCLMRDDQAKADRLITAGVARLVSRWEQDRGIDARVIDSLLHLRDQVAIDFPPDLVDTRPRPRNKELR